MVMRITFTLTGEDGEILYHGTERAIDSLVFTMKQIHVAENTLLFAGFTYTPIVVKIPDREDGGA